MNPRWLPISYPLARQSDHIDTYQSESKGDVSVKDPFNWLEEHTEEVTTWIEEQEGLTRAYLDRNPDRQRLEDAFRDSKNYATFDCPALCDDNRWYWSYNSGLQHQNVIYRSKDATLPEFNDGTGSEEVFFDPNLLSSDGTIALTDFAISKCGKFFAYCLSQSGSDERTLYVRSTDAPLNKSDDIGRSLDKIEHVKFSNISWMPDSSGFFYQRFPSAEADPISGIKISVDENAMIYFHRTGTDQSEDILVHKDKNNPTWKFGLMVTDDKKYLVLYTHRDTARKNLIWVAPLKDTILDKPIRWQKLFDFFDAEYSYVANDGPIFFFKTNKDAPKSKLISIDTSASKPFSPKVVIPERKEAQLCAVWRVNNNRFVVLYNHDVKHQLYIYDNDGEQLEHLFPEFVGSMEVECHPTQPWVTVKMSGFTTPGTIAYYDFTRPEGQRTSTIRQIRVRGLNPDEFETSQVWYNSKDGTPIPMFIVRHKSTLFDGTAPAIQYGYGGFNVSIDPWFSPTFLTFIQIYGGVLAVPNIRGGDEFGEDWHLGGCLENKKNCFDDFIAATEYLVNNKYVCAGKVAINGGSNGGLLVAACVNRAPEGTFGAAVAEVAVLDMLKFHKFTCGNSWISDYGNPNDPHDFDFIYPISPLHNIPANGHVLPPFILLTADHDDRVVPMHSFKHIATLQHNRPENPHPLLLRVDRKAGHGAGKSVEKWIQEAADKWGFVAQTMELVWKEQQTHL